MQNSGVEYLQIFYGFDTARVNYLRKKYNLPGYQVLIPPDDEFFENYPRLHGLQVIIDKNLEVFAITNPGGIGQIQAKQLLEAINIERKRPVLKKAGIWLMNLSLAFSLAYSVFYWQNRQQKKRTAIQQQIKDLELQAIRARINPHFIFNALNSIRYLVHQNQVEKAGQYLEQFASLLRLVLNNSGKEFVSISEELQTIRNYVALEQLRFNFHFQETLDADPELAHFEIPGMLIQPLIENAVVHAMSIKKENGLLKLKINRTINRIDILVEDNGPGFNHENQYREKNRHGLQLVEDRINLLKEKYGMDIRLKFESESMEFTRAFLNIETC